MRGGGASEQGVRDERLEGGAAAVESGSSPGPNAVERGLAAEVEELKAALGEAHVELRVWKKSAEYRLGPSRTSR